MAFAQKFRSSFGNAFAKNYLQWFPGHMEKGLKQMQQQLLNVDCIIEVHDARIPISGRNELFRTKLLGVRPHLLLLNKCDLILEREQPVILDALKKHGYSEDVLFTDCRTPEGSGVVDVVPAICNKILNVQRYHRSSENSFNLLVIGVPNVGKSSLINVLRNYHAKKRKATRVGAVAGVTRAVLTKIQVCYDPPLYLLDSPGILEPQVRNVEAAFRLALCASMQDHLVGTTNIADYLLFWLNNNRRFGYVKKLGLKGESDDIIEVLTQFAVNKNLFIKLKDPTTGKIVLKPNFDKAAADMVKLYRQGEFGLYVLDSDLLQKPPRP